jgi:hypothetical protein
MHSPSGQQVTWKFVKSLGVHLGTNFGLMFDALTGQDFAADDPRRE